VWGREDVTQQEWLMNEDCRRAFGCYRAPMKLRFTAIFQQGEKYLLATCPEVPEAHGQGLTRQECLRDLEESIQSVLGYRREEALAKLDRQIEHIELELA
jgi:predicted RNase H-like HicB family nuclease